MQTYILLDRSGSMQGMWGEAISSINAYVEELKKPEPETGKVIETRVTLATFDSHVGHMDFDVLRDGISTSAWSELSDREISPRGMTPLFDAIGTMIQKATEDDNEKTVIVIMTDGHENSSREFTSTSMKALLDSVRARGWEVVFLGANFSNFRDADTLGIVASKRMAMASGNMRDAKMALARKSRRYAMSLDETISFDENDRREAGEDRV